MIDILKDQLKRTHAEKVSLQQEKNNVLQRNETFAVENKDLKTIIGDKDLQIKELQDLLHAYRTSKVLDFILKFFRLKR